MRIQNIALRDQVLALPARDDRPALTTRGSDIGIFDVPDAWGRWLIATPGWKEVTKSTKSTAHAAAQSPALERRSFAPPPVPEEDDVPTDPGTALEHPNATIADELEAMGKISLLERAQKLGIELTAEQKKLKVGELRALVVELSAAKR